MMPFQNGDTWGEGAPLATPLDLKAYDILFVWRCCILTRNNYTPAVGYTALLRATLTNGRSGQLRRAPHAFEVSKVKLQIRGNQALSTLEELLFF